MSRPQINIPTEDLTEDHSLSETVSLISYLEIVVITCIDYEYFSPTQVPLFLQIIRWRYKWREKL